MLRTRAFAPLLGFLAVGFDGKIYDPSYGTSFTAGADLAANQLALELASVAGFVSLKSKPVVYNDLKAGAGATELNVYLYRKHTGTAEFNLTMLKAPNPTATLK